MNEGAYAIGVTAVMLPELDFDEQLALCVELGLTHYTLRPRVISDAQREQSYSNWGNHKFDLTPQRLLDEAESIKRALADAGLTPFGTVPSVTTDASDDEVKLHLEGAAAVGAGRVRMNPMKYPSGYFDYEAYLKRVISRYEEVLEWSQPLGVKLVMETHAWSPASGPGVAWNICRHFDPSDVSVIFDLPNFAREGNLAPGYAVAVLAKYIDHCHVGGSKRTHGEYDELGFRKAKNEFVPLSESDMHFPTWLAALNEADVRVPLVIEEYTANVPGATRLRQTAPMVKRAVEALG